MPCIHESTAKPQTKCVFLSKGIRFSPWFFHQKLNERASRKIRKNGRKAEMMAMGGRGGTSKQAEGTGVRKMIIGLVQRVSHHRLQIHYSPLEVGSNTRICGWLLPIQLQDKIIHSC